MAAPAPVATPPPDPLGLHQRLADGDPTAPDAFASTFLDSLLAWLTEHNPSAAPDLIAEAAEEAILKVIRNPQTYKPERGTLEAYLRMSALGDLRNLLRDERNHRASRVSLAFVELFAADGNQYGRDDDPSLPLRIAEEQAELRRKVPRAVWDSLSEVESTFLELMLQGERRTARYAAACGFADRPPPEQARIKKQIGDRLIKRIQRAERDDEQERGTTGPASPA